MSQEELQQELEAIDAIYPDFMERLSETQCVIKIPEHEAISVHLSFPTGYPTQSAPQVLQVNGAHDPKALRDQFEGVMEDIWKQDVCIFDFLTEVAEACSQVSDQDLLLSESDVQADAALQQQLESLQLEVSAAALDVTWFQSDPVVDRGSTFIAFAAHASSEEDACLKLDQLRMDPKVSKCQHVMTAWRIRGEGSVTYQDCEDDGETAAGGRLLHLLTLMDAWDVVVGVARWFTGTHIGPDRFKHINSTAREAVLRGSFADASKAGKKKK
ncbi:RWD domain-containing protein [Lachancea thermotolerans]|uniref:KLTH0A06424p n=1 Tax=Lachancea thermotolerans (strain ATCC 56472 / CBS 6340 / NRRL Y-8284) TaxID=559295 RepID=C5DBY8_LACTC|nr:KLTH0A06424p [Lachancea thermotolerans CBS 6340]CAR21295.1 KLTH0A06424p [Lachancea thermotolerans CBS 6340]